MFHIPSDVFPVNVTANPLKNRCCPDVTRQCVVICFWSGAEARAIDRVLYNSDHLQAQVAREEGASCWITPVAEMRHGWPAMSMICPMRKVGREWVLAVFHDDVDEHDHWPNGRDTVLRSLSSFGLDGEAHA